MEHLDAMLVLLKQLFFSMEHLDATLFLSKQLLSSMWHANALLVALKAIASQDRISGHLQWQGTMPVPLHSTHQVLIATIESAKNASNPKPYNPTITPLTETKLAMSFRGFRTLSPKIR